MKTRWAITGSWEPLVKIRVYTIDDDDFTKKFNLRVERSLKLNISASTEERCRRLSLVFVSIFLINTTGQMTPHLFSMSFPQAYVIICINVTVQCHYIVGINSFGRWYSYINFKRWPILRIFTGLSSVAEYHINCLCTELSSLLCILSSWWFYVEALAINGYQGKTLNIL